MRLILYVILVLGLFGCGPQTMKPAKTQDTELEAKQILATGDYTGAAQKYLQLAKLYPKSASWYQVQAAAAYLEADEIDAVIELLKTTRVAATNEKGAALKQIVEARLALKTAQAEKALNILASPFPPEIGNELLSKRQLTRAEAYSLLNNHFSAAQARIQLHKYLETLEDKQRNIEELWNVLNSIKPQLLETLRTSSTGLMRSWIELALINHAHLFKPDLLTKSLNSWKEQYPEHPADPVITQRMLQLSSQYNLYPQQIAVLLPFSGKYQKAANAIRDGLMTAWYDSASYQPEIKFYNTNALNIRTSYQNAIDDGAEFIIGPLEKQAVRTLAESSDIAVSILALNQIDDITESKSERLRSNISNLLQFSLSPEDESRQIAQRGIFDGHNRALIITPNSDWGERLYEAFNDEWTNLGGTILEHVTYDSNTKDYRTPVKKLLNVDSSERRFRILRERLSRRLLSEGRLREDADMIFMAATPVAARQLVPQLRFFRANKITVYTSSRAYSGRPDPKSDRDMNDVIFLDMPWVLDPIEQNSLLQEKINLHWSANSSVYRRFYALGVDAFELIPELGRLTLQEHTRYYGKTGELYMTEKGQILRKLLWAKFSNGRPLLLEQDINH